MPLTINRAQMVLTLRAEDVVAAEILAGGVRLLI
jgi:hypothetical protein